MRSAKVMGAVAALVLVAAAVAFAWTGREVSCSDFRFDAERWREKVDHRHNQADALVRCGVLLGETRAEVRRLLGRPDPEGGRTEWTYYLGAERSVVAVDAEYLDMTFEGGRVADASVNPG